MYNAEVFMRNSCKVDTANIVYTKGQESKVEYEGKSFDATYDHDRKMFVVDDTEEIVQ